jgi:hypothetical protein
MLVRGYAFLSFSGYGIDFSCSAALLLLVACQEALTLQIIE